MISKYGFHTFLFSLLPIMFLYQFNIHEIFLHDIIIPLLASVGIVFLFWLLLKYFVGTQKSSLFISWFLVLFAVHGNLHYLLLTQNDVVLSFLGKNIILGPIFLSLFVIVIIIISKTKSFEEKTYFANIMSITIIGFLSISIVLYYVENPVDSSALKYVDLPLVVADIEKKPDVYLFLLDEFAGRITLEKDFDYDLTNFENELENRGFQVSKESFSNYPNTNLSAPSFLNMFYLDFLSEELGPDSKDLRLVRELLLQNNVMKIFKKNGYSITSFYGGLGVTGAANLVDEKLCSFGTINSDLRKNFVNTYMPISYFNEFLLVDHHQKKLECFFSTIENFERDEQRPSYIHGHISLPHEPFIFNEQGNIVPHIYSADAYLAQLIFTEQKTLELIDSIHNRTPDAVIVIMSDHGYRYEIDWENPTNVDYMRGFNTITAFSFPGHNYTIPTEISAVNVFRILFNEIFNADYELLENRQIWYTDDRRFDFIEVSSDFKK